MPGPGNCDPVCWKIILNGGLVAINARRFARTANGSVADAATDLANAAEAMLGTYDFLVQRGAIVRTGEVEWSGCDQATTLVGWIADDATGSEVVATMEEWRKQFEAHTLAMVSGGLQS